MPYSDKPAGRSTEAAFIFRQQASADDYLLLHARAVKKKHVLRHGFSKTQDENSL